MYEHPKISPLSWEIHWLRGRGTKSSNNLKIMPKTTLKTLIIKQSVTSNLNLNQ